MAANEPAYPTPLTSTGNGDVQYGAPKLSIRQHFAIEILKGMYAGGSAQHFESARDMAQAARQRADFLLDELEITRGR